MRNYLFLFRFGSSAKPKVISSNRRKKEMHFSYVFISSLTAALLMLILVACSSAKQVASSKDFAPGTNSTFKIYILDNNWHDLRLDPDIQDAWSVLKQIDLNHSLFVITADDIAVYNWSQQTITLTEDTSIRLKNKLFQDEMALPLTSKKNAFVVVIGEKRLFGGIFLDQGSAIKTSYPVIYPNLSREKVIFTVRPMHPIWMKYEDMSASQKQAIELREIYDLFKSLGKLGE